ncbi:erythroferrone isoform X2 [Synchiropus splendidus]|uniref:erythroferrone isoform X2 n=1 Tax=Synchiropus splendidus TaxID=270530 RepID=UPI00237EBACC|nr:erythroferrone isoform X2 [Synchiropus splendidus]
MSLKTEAPLTRPTLRSRSYVLVMLAFKRRSSGGAGESQLLGQLVMMMMMVVTMVAADIEGLDGEESLEILEDDEADGAENGESLDMSPLHSWLIFRRNSNKGDNRKTKGTKRSSKHGLPGPPGPPGPQGPPGLPASPQWPKQELVEELRQKLQGRWTGACLQCDRAPRIAASFHSRLPHPVAVPRRSLLELQTFSQAGPVQNRLQRGGSFNISTGRYSAPVSGFYQVTASLLIESGERQQHRLRDSVRASVCIESLCQRNLSVQSMMGVAVSGGTFSMLLTGALYLQAGEYVSVFVDNGTGSSISVLADSSFSGILLGV